MADSAQPCVVELPGFVMGFHLFFLKSNLVCSLTLKSSWVQNWCGTIELFLYLFLFWQNMQNKQNFTAQALCRMSCWVQNWNGTIEFF